MRHSLRLFVCVLALGLPFLATAQSYPAKPIRWIVPYPPGGAFDAITRVVAVSLAAGLGQQVVIDNGLLMPLNIVRVRRSFEKEVK